MASDNGYEREREWLRQDQTFVTVTLSAGVFHWLYGIVESKHKVRHYEGWIPWYQELIDRAYSEMRAGINQDGEAEVPSEQPRTRVIHRRVAKGGRRR